MPGTALTPRWPRRSDHDYVTAKDIISLSHLEEQHPPDMGFPGPVRRRRRRSSGSAAAEFGTARDAEVHGRFRTIVERECLPSLRDGVISRLDVNNSLRPLAARDLLGRGRRRPTASERRGPAPRLALGQQALRSASAASTRSPKPNPKSSQRARQGPRKAGPPGLPRIFSEVPGAQ
jgi:hypothetical protein